MSRCGPPPWGARLGTTGKHPVGPLLGPRMGAPGDRAQAWWPASSGARHLPQSSELPEPTAKAGNETQWKQIGFSSVPTC